MKLAAGLHVLKAPPKLGELLVVGLQYELEDGCTQLGPTLHVRITQVPRLAAARSHRLRDG